MKGNKTRNENFASKTEIPLYTKEIIGIEGENQRQESTMAGTMKELKTVTCNPVMQTNNNNFNDKIYSVASTNSQKLNNKKDSYVCESNNIHREVMQAENNKMCKKIEIKMGIDKTNKISNSRNKQSSTHDKKDNLKKVKSNIGKITKPKTTRKSNKKAESIISNDITYKEIEDKEYSKKSLSALPFACSNNANNMLSKNIPYYGVTMQEKSHPYGLNNMNVSQYMEDNNLRYTNQQMIFMNSNRWLITSENDQNFALNNMQNKMEQSNFTNDRQYHTYADDHNWKQNENPYLYSSINSINPNKMFRMENKDHCSCSACMNNQPNNIYVGIQNFPKVNAYQQRTDNATSYTSSATISSHLLNATVEPYNNIHNYQTSQTEYNFKKLFYRNSNVMNYVYSNNCDTISIAKERAMSPLNNWYMNGSTTPYNNSLSVPYNIPITYHTSEVLPLNSLYIGATNAHFHNYQNRDMVKANISMDQYGGRDSFNPYTMSSFENQSSTFDALNINSNEFMNTSQSSPTNMATNDIMPNIMNCLPETNVADVSDEPLPCVSAKKKDWISDIINTIDKDNF